MDHYKQMKWLSENDKKEPMRKVPSLMNIVLLE